MMNMTDDRDMFYNSYGFSGPMPAPGVGMTQAGYGAYNPGMVINPGMGSTTMGQMGNANMGNNVYGEIDNRLTRLENQIKKLEQRLARLETPYTTANNTTNIYNEPDGNMYMI